MSKLTPEEHVEIRLRTARALERDVSRLEWDKMLVEQKSDELPSWVMERDFEVRPRFAKALEELHHAVVFLIEARSMPGQLESFRQKFGEEFNGYAASTVFELFDDESPEPYNKFLWELTAFLAPFNVEAKSETALSRRVGMQYLERLLSNTASIVAWFAEPVSRESDLHKIVTKPLNILFPSTRNCEGRFNSIFKSFKPDILIPELSTAIEFKYVNSLQDLKGVLGEIAEDVKGYSGDDVYNQFIAVFYLTEMFCTREQFALAWSEMKFPDNWRSIYSVAPP